MTRFSPKIEIINHFDNINIIIKHLITLKYLHNKTTTTKIKQFILQKLYALNDKNICYKLILLNQFFFSNKSFLMK